MKKGIFILIGFLHLLTGFLLPGAGHGWNTGFFFSVVSFVTLCTMTFIPNRKPFNYFILLLSCVLSVLLVFHTRREGAEYFLKIWNAVPFLVLLYFSLWLSWPVIAITRLVRKSTNNEF